MGWMSAESTCRYQGRCELCLEEMGGSVEGGKVGTDYEDVARRYLREGWMNVSWCRVSLRWKLALCNG